MKQIDQDPREHSHLYELKPISRWWLLLAAGLAVLALFNAGLADWRSWALLFFGALLLAILVLVFPRYFLSRRD